MFHHRGGGIGTYIANGNAALCGAGEVDIVGAGRGDTDQAQAICCEQGIPVESCLVGNNNLSPADECLQLPGVGLFEQGPVIQCCGQWLEIKVICSNGVDIKKDATHRVRYCTSVVSQHALL